MRNILRLCFVAIIILSAAINSSAQTFGIKGGLNLSNTVIIIGGDKFDSELKINPGFHIGPTLELDLSNVFSIETGVLLTTKGFRVNSTRPDETGVEEAYKVKSNLYYIDIPFNAKATIELNGYDVYGTVGPYLGIGIQGKGKLEFGDEIETSTIKFGKDENLKRLEFGLAFGGGMEINRFLFGLGYNLGLTNISNNEHSQKFKNRVIQISVGYRFGKRKAEKSEE